MATYKEREEARSVLFLWNAYPDRCPKLKIEERHAIAARETLSRPFEFADLDEVIWDSQSESELAYSLDDLPTTIRKRLQSDPARTRAIIEKLLADS